MSTVTYAYVPTSRFNVYEDIGVKAIVVQGPREMVHKIHSAVQEAVSTDEQANEREVIRALCIAADATFCYEDEPAPVNELTATIASVANQVQWSMVEELPSSSECDFKMKIPYVYYLTGGIAFSMGY